MTLTVKTVAVELRVETFGGKCANPVLLIAGAMAPAAFWHESFCETLAAAGRFVVRFDNRDAGHSTHFPPCRPGSGVELAYTLEDMAGDAAAIADALSLDRLTVAGHSMGASIAQTFAALWPDRVTNLFCLSSPLVAKGNNLYAETDPKILKKLWKVLLSNKMYPDCERGMDEFARVWKALNGGFPLDRGMADDYTRHLYETETIEPAWNHTKVQEGVRDLYGDLARLQAPIRFIHGERDYLPSDPANVKILADSLPNADFTLLPRAGHMFFDRGLWMQIAGIFLDKSNDKFTARHRSAGNG